MLRSPGKLPPFPPLSTGLDAASLVREGEWKTTENKLFKFTATSFNLSHKQWAINNDPRTITVSLGALQTFEVMFLIARYLLVMSPASVSGAS